jgi:hypothetical protein
MKTHKSLTIASSAFALALLGIAAMPAASAQQAAAGGAADSSFQSLDANHDGHLSRSEIPNDMTLLRSRYSSYDLNQDGYLDAQEFAAGKAAVQGSGHAMGSDAPTPQPRSDESHP